MRCSAASLKQHIPIDILVRMNFQDFTKGFREPGLFGSLFILQIFSLFVLLPSEREKLQLRTQLWILLSFTWKCEKLKK